MDENEKRKVDFWNEWFREDDELKSFADDGDFDMCMAVVYPNDFEHISEVCSGREDQFGSFEEFVENLFEMKREGRGDFWTVEDDWFCFDTNGFVVSEATADGIIGYILENSMFDLETAHGIQERFDKDYTEYLMKQGG